MRIFGSDRVSGLMQKLGMEEGEAIEHPWVTKAIENAQRKVEGRNFDIRKQLLEYDDVANDQRTIVYQERNRLMDAEDIYENVEAMRGDVVNEIIDHSVPPQSLEEQWDIDGLEKELEAEFGLTFPVKKWLEEDTDLHEETLRDRITDTITDAYNTKVTEVGEPVMRHLEKAITLQVLDSQWKEHLAAMDHLRQGIGLRGYAQKNPKQEYKREAFEMFQALLGRVKQEVVTLLSKIQIRTENEVERLEAERREQAPQSMNFVHPDMEGHESPAAQSEGGAQPEQPPLKPVEQPFVRQTRKIGRNEPCPCGSGKKYKQCHGRLSA
jgi:preprotein translocase subunit SecA